MFRCRIIAMLTLGTATPSPYRRHETVLIRAGAGQHQHVPWPRVGYSDGDGADDPSGLGDNAVFGSLGGFTDVEKQQLAERVRSAISSSDVAAIFEIIPTIPERQEVAARAIALGADPRTVRQALSGPAQGERTFFSWPSMPVRIIWSAAIIASIPISAYHGYKRGHNSVGGAVIWGLLSVFFPIITPAVAALWPPGYAKPPRGGLGRTRSYRRRGRKSRRS
jgi:hypothetical protein